MKIYTKTGDKGETSLFGGKRVSKSDARLEAYGTVDELNSALGVCRSLQPPSDLNSVLTTLQESLFLVGADLATPGDAKARVQRITVDDAARLEGIIDEYEAKLDPIRSFILPAGTQLASAIHLARSVCRRAERAVVRLRESEDVNNTVVVYLNRLGDLLFVLARYANKSAGVPDEKWAT